MGGPVKTFENYSHSHIDGLVIETARVLAGLETPGGQLGLRGNTPRGHRQPGGGAQGGEGQGGVVLVSDHGALEQAQRGVTSDQHRHRPHHDQLACHFMYQAHCVPFYGHQLDIFATISAAEYLK